MSEYDELLTALGSAVLCRGDECRDKSARGGCICAMAKSAIEELEAKLAKAVEALDKLARLGNGEKPGNSDGNMIARATLAEINGGGDE